MPGDFQAADTGPADVEKNEVGLQLLCFFQCSVPSGASPQTCHFGSDDKSAATPETYPLVIIGNENTQERQPAVPATLLSGNARRLVLK